jgi:hypothetical protein
MERIDVEQQALCFQVSRPNHRALAYLSGNIRTGILPPAGLPNQKEYQCIGQTATLATGSS